MPQAAPPFTYARRRQDTTALYEVVRDNVATLYRAVEDETGKGLPEFVKSELEGYLGCGLLCRGFAHLRCEACAERRLVYGYDCIPTMRDDWLRALMNAFGQVVLEHASISHILGVL